MFLGDIKKYRAMIMSYQKIGLKVKIGA